ncbi:cytochrome C [Candidatus Endobugula sertula]|uniref:Cytochrome C n=1 Tax=Candidatus Endobugula sertula TaxID=62101 RepID=A0A1D2QSS2_9GAMM|nr:cytochrome C [Candidatus Endobugula sertula]
MNNTSKFLPFLILTLSLSSLAIKSQAAGDPKAGQTLAASCAGCHGADGNSPAPSFPKLAGVGEKYLYKQMLDIQSGKRPIAQMAGQLDGKSDQGLLDLAAYFNNNTMQLSGAKALQVKVNAGIKVDGLKLGERIFRSGNLETNTPACTGCHSPRGLGNDPAGFPRLSGQYPEYIAKQLRDFRGGERTNDGDAKTMRQVAEHMSDAEIDAVANYIGGLY